MGATTQRRMSFNTLYAKARRGKVELQRTSSFDGMVDGFSRDVSDWFKPTVEELRKIKDQGGLVHWPDNDTLSSHVDYFNLRVS